MTTPTLRDILGAAYSTRSKVASAASTRPPTTELTGDFIAQSLGLEPGAAATPTTKTAHTEETAVADLDFAEKIAKALERSAMIVTKLASEQPTVVEPNNTQVSTVPKAVTTAHGAIDGTGKDEKSQGLPGGVQTDSTSSTHKQAAHAMVRSKLAQAEQLFEAGERDLAQQILLEADAMAKTAGFSIAPANLPAQSTDFMLSTTMPSSSHAPTNEQAIALTKSQVRDKTTAEAKEHIAETPKKDNAVPAAISHTEGLKTSALLREKVAGRTKQASAAELIETRNFLEKVAAHANSAEATDEDREYAAILIERANTHGLGAVHAVLTENS
jgi:hypothetical protein